ncbi:Rep [Vegetivirus loriverwastis]|uniref:ATP-dependent helicase Rep n=1 Tax=uncultured virus TaxID=340016 RepID=A0A2K9LSY9_9VIRU|nr:Rep [uncultured virus]
MSRVRAFIFTLNNYTPEEESQIQNIECEYLVYGHETGENNTPHLQGYIEFKNPRVFNTIANLIPRWHVEIRRGTALQAKNYCLKQDKNNFFEKGTFSTQGKRTDLDKIRTIALEDGMRLVTQIGTLVQIQTAEKFLSYNEEPRDWLTKVIWIHGKTGSGKSRHAREILQNQDIYVKNNGTKWWTGYDAHEAVIIDDFRDSWWSLTEMLSLLDRYEKVVETKGAQRQFKPKTIIITCIYSPDTLYKGTGEDIQQLLRRITEIIELQ